MFRGLKWIIHTRYDTEALRVLQTRKFGTRKFAEQVADDVAALTRCLVAAGVVHPPPHDRSVDGRRVNRRVAAIPNVGIREVRSFERREGSLWALKARRGSAGSARRRAGALPLRKVDCGTELRHRGFTRSGIVSDPVFRTDYPEISIS